MSTHTKPMGPLPGTPGDFRKSPWFWTILGASLLMMALGIFFGDAQPQRAGVLASVGIAGFALSAVIAAMASLRSRRRDDEKLRESP